MQDTNIVQIRGVSRQPKTEEKWIMELTEEGGRKEMI